ncbi:MAG: AMP-binding protein [Lachnospiraceae bacterium]|nr:AMP-binding protein [Lachnospiraceae bacterium]
MLRNREGDYVTLCLPNIPEIIYFIYALNRIGAVACLIDPRTNVEGILERTNESESKLLIAISDIIEEKINPIVER